VNGATWTAELEPDLDEPRSEPAPVPARRQRGDADAKRAESYARAALEREADTVRNTGKGSRNATLNISALRLGQLVAGGHLEEGDVVRELTRAALDAGLGKQETRATIGSGLKKGKTEPRHPPERQPSVRFSGGPPDDPGLDDELSAFGPSDELEGPEWLNEGEANSEEEQPTLEQPMRGLRHLGAVALVGRERILELAAKPIEYVWIDIAPPGIITVIAGKPADGKTTLLFIVLVARANLEAPIVVLGREIRPAPPGQFLVLIEGEHSEASTSRKLVKSCGLVGVDDMALDRIIIVARKAVRLGSPEWHDVGRLVRAGLVSDIAIDTVARVAPGDGDSEREQVAIFDGVAQVIELSPEGVLPPNVWAVAHVRKNGNTGGLDDVAGSVQRTGQADTVLMMSAEREDGRVVSTKVVFAKLREDPDEYPEPAEIIIRKGADGKALLTTGVVTRPAADDRPLESKIWCALADGPKTKNALSKATGRNKADLEVPISLLFGARAIESTTVTIKGSNYTAFQRRHGATWGAKSTPDVTPDPAYAGPTPDVTPDEAGLS
jgi:hypothetical protein